MNTRRCYFKAVGIIASAIVGLVLAPSNSYAEEPHVIVVGAGAAGLAAAGRLAEENYTVTVLEARNRFGGRVNTSEIGDQGEEITIDLGASWVHGVHPEFIEIVNYLKNQRGLETVNSVFTNLLIHKSDGSEIDPEDPLVVELADRLFTALVVNNLSSCCRNKPLQDIIDDMWTNIFDDFSTVFANEEELVNFITTGFFEIETAQSAEQVPAKAFLEWIPPLNLWPLFMSEEGDDNWAFPGGFKQVIDYLAEGLEGNIVINAEVTEIDYSQNQVVVTTANGEPYTADFVVVTVPIGVLKNDDITFTPALPPRKQGAIDRMGVGVLNKLYLEFDDVFWPDKDNLGISVEPPSAPGDPDTTDDFAMWVNMEKITDEPVLMAFISGDAAVAMEGKSVQEVEDLAMARLRSVSAYANAPDPKNSVFTNWYNDPYARGSYSSFGLATKLGDRAILGEPVGDKLYFAGEATIDFGFAQVPGAYMSGLREGQRIVDWVNFLKLFGYFP